MRIALESVAVDVDGRRILGELDLTVESGGRLALLGPSGSGKSTLLRVIAGLQRPTAGRVVLDGRDATSVQPHRRGVGLLFQDGVLFPHRDVGRNVAYALEIARLPRTQIQQKVVDTLELVGLPGAERRTVETLSGGEAQRVALARALVAEPRALLLDEPLSGLDGPLRQRLRGELRTLFDELSLTVVHVTHDVDEAFAVGGRIAMLRDGRLVQVDTPDRIWARPADAWVARLLGMENVTEQDGRTTVVPADAVALAPGGDAVVEAVELRPGGASVVVRLKDGHRLTAQHTGVGAPQPGDRVMVTVDASRVLELPDRDR